MMRKIVLTVIILFSIIVFASCNGKKENQSQEIKEEISYNFEMILEVAPVMSSNPYDYTKNEYYKNVVEIGPDAVPVLKEMFDNKEITGVLAYVSALAVQDITGCNLYKDHNLDWSTAEEFYELWEENNCFYHK